MTIWTLNSWGQSSTRWTIVVWGGPGSGIAKHATLSQAQSPLTKWNYFSSKEGGVEAFSYLKQLENLNKKASKTNKKRLHQAYSKFFKDLKEVMQAFWSWNTLQTGSVLTLVWPSCHIKDFSFSNAINNFFLKKFGFSGLPDSWKP